MPSSRTGPLYNAFSYPTKISPEAIALYIATHTTPGATVLDTFAGSGSTGLAAKLCDQPTPWMIAAAGELGLKPKWGTRRAILYELSAIGSFTARVMCNPPDPKLFAAEATCLVTEAYTRLKNILSASNDPSHDGVLRHIIWSDVLKCHYCGTEHTFWDVAVKQLPLSIQKNYECPACSRYLQVDSTIRVTNTIFDQQLNKYVEQKKRVPVRVYGLSGKKKWQRPITQKDLDILVAVSKMPIPASAPIAELRLGDLYRAGYHTGITHLHHFYTRRNLICLATLWELIGEREKSVQDALRLLVLSYNQSHSTLMTRVVVKDGESDFVLTGAQSGVLYISSLPVEKNVLEGVTRKIASFSSAFAMVEKSRSTVVVHNKSSTELNETNESIDYIFTDPPFGDYIPYSEINQVNELWLGNRTNPLNEAIVSPAQGKTVANYADLMGRVFREINRVLRPDGCATVVFHSAKASIWAALQQAYQGAGLQVRATSVLDKLQASFKQVVSNVSVKGDPLLLLTKGNKISQFRNISADRLLNDLVRQARLSADTCEVSPERLYSRYVAKCLELGASVPMNANEFYALIRGGAAP